jgi:hypothetical protein
MWIYKVKSDTLGDVSRLKAQFVAKAYSQGVGLDYTETFSRVIRMANLRLFLHILSCKRSKLSITLQYPTHLAIC